MTDVRLDRTDRAPTTCRGPRREHPGEGGDFDRVPERRSRAVGLDVGNRVGAAAGESLCLGDDGGLAGHARGRVAGLCVAVVVDRGTLDHRVDPVTVGECVGQPPQDDDPDAATDDRALRPGVEGPATTVRRQDHPLLEEVALDLWHPDVGGTGQRQIALSAQQTHAGHVHGHERGGACGVHTHGRSAQVQLVGHTRRQEILVVGQHQPVALQRRPRPEAFRQIVQEVGVQPGTGVDTCHTRVGVRVVTGVFKCRK